MKQLARVANVYRSLYFITSQHPQLHSSALDIVNCLSDFILQLVFDGCRANQVEINLKFFGHFIDRSLFVNLRSSFLIFSVPVLILFVLDLFRGDQERSQSLLRVSIQETLCLGYVFVFRFQTLLYNRIGSFRYHQDSILRRAHYHRHSFSCGVKFDQIEKLIFADTVPRFTYEVIILISLTEVKPQIACTIYKGQLVWTRCIVCYIIFSCFLIFFLVCNNCMTQTESCKETLKIYAVFMFPSLNMLLIIGVLKVYICDS